MDLLETLKALNDGILADSDAADAAAQKSLAAGAERISGAFAEGWTAGGIDAWLTKRQAAKDRSANSQGT